MSSVGAVRTRTKINDVNKNILLRKTVKKYAKSMLTVDNDGVSQTSYTFKKQFIITSNASGQIVITAGTNETFNALSNTNYTITVLDDGSGGCNDGDIIDIDDINHFIFNDESID